MRRFWIAFLKDLERLLPPPLHCHHALTYAQYGSDKAGWEDKLALQINRGGTFLCVFLDESDCDFRPDDLVGARRLATQVAECAKEPIKTTTQLGKGTGRYC